PPVAVDQRKDRWQQEAIDVAHEMRGAHQSDDARIACSPPCHGNLGRRYHCESQPRQSPDPPALSQNYRAGGKGAEWLTRRAWFSIMRWGGHRRNFSRFLTSLNAGLMGFPR